MQHWLIDCLIDCIHFLIRSRKFNRIKMESLLVKDCNNSAFDQHQRSLRRDLGAAIRWDCLIRRIVPETPLNDKPRVLITSCGPRNFSKGRKFRWVVFVKCFPIDFQFKGGWWIATPMYMYVHPKIQAYVQ